MNLGTGSALGIDCAEGFLDVGRADAARDGVTGATFRCGDAQTEKFPADFDVCFSRFGTMFFANPVAALANLRRATRPGGRLLMLVWRRIDDSPLWAIPKQVARRHLPPPPDEAPKCGPGPFSLADPDTVRGMLAAAGWREPALEAIDGPVRAGDTADDAIAFQLAIGPAGEIVREAGALGDEKRPLILADLRTALAPYTTADGVVLARRLVVRHRPRVSRAQNRYCTRTRKLNMSSSYGDVVALFSKCDFAYPTTPFTKSCL